MRDKAGRTRPMMNHATALIMKSAAPASSAADVRGELAAAAGAPATTPPPQCILMRRRAPRVKVSRLETLSAEQTNGRAHLAALSAAAAVLRGEDFDLFGARERSNARTCRTCRPLCAGVMRPVARTIGRPLCRGWPARELIQIRLSRGREGLARGGSAAAYARGGGGGISRADWPLCK